MFQSRYLGALPLALLLAACSGQQTGDDATADTAPGELSPSASTAPNATLPPADTASSTADMGTSSETAEADEAATMGEATDATGDTPISSDERVQTMPPNPARDPDPIAEDPRQELQDSASPPPPVQQH